MLQAFLQVLWKKRRHTKIEYFVLFLFKYISDSLLWLLVSKRPFGNLKLKTDFIKWFEFRCPDGASSFRPNTVIQAMPRLLREETAKRKFLNKPSYTNSSSEKTTKMNGRSNDSYRTYRSCKNAYKLVFPFLSSCFRWPLSIIIKSSLTMKNN